VAADAQNPAAALALSYAQQSGFDVEAALATLQVAVTSRPDDALLWARLSELYLSVGELERALDAAQQAEQRNPGLARTQSVLGFANLTQIRIPQAKAAFERAIELDPQFAKAYWRLAVFWANQMSETLIGAGTVEIASDEMQALYDEAIDDAIRLESDPVNQIFYRAHKALNQSKLRQALRLNSEYLDQRPLDQSAQNQQLTLLAILGTNDEVVEAVRQFYDLDGHDVIVTQASITRLTYAGDNEFLREFSYRAIERFPDQVFVHYQAHRGLLWAGDIDGAAQLLPYILSSDLPESSRYMVQLRQACAENRTHDAKRLYERGKRQFADETSMMWLSHLIMGETEAAVESLRDLDDPEDLEGLADFLTYGTFDPRPYPNLMAMLDSQAVEPRDALTPPYQCKL
jgi:tetratricopeptide (TPR) repeat protein